jgi:ferrous iron transport protein B
MLSSHNINVALIGNPNVGKTSVFNQLTGLNQQVGNYPGITVEKKIGFCKLPNNYKANILDLPGTYSLNASSIDENVVIELLLNKNDKLYCSGQPSSTTTAALSPQPAQPRASRRAP